MRLPKDSLYSYARAYGFGSPTGADLPGEVGGILRKPFAWSKMTLAAFPMGQEVAVTAMQMATAYGAIANRGVLVQPYVVAKITDTEGKSVYSHKMVKVRRIISESVAETLCNILQAVVDSGTATQAQIKGLHIAGKTGTAQKVKPNGWGYYDDQFVSSFVGFAPVESPQIVGVVVVDNPSMGPHWGGWTAAPIWSSIVNKAFAQGILSIEESKEISENETGEIESDFVAVPDVRRMTSSQAVEVLNHRNLEADISGSGTVLVQSPQPGRMVPPETPVHIVLKANNFSDGAKIEIPSVIGKPLRDAATDLSLANIRFTVIGSGSVVEQNPPAKSYIDRNGVCLLKCKQKTSR
jgi:membrane peptidoglycan carboxypeptidase